ncbi:ASPIC and UnbV [Hartmannibacter diazotrophicus]|uniref:ASPIC and UnbV n=1 Tax=Hartmannibacter diazotrophicus TaxID=1482074 RepID=A0A2C9D4M4_9HYPH|nr:ASPIC and UnbV [Hartmannibacter diazotrophicus]
MMNQPAIRGIFGVLAALPALLAAPAFADETLVRQPTSDIPSMHEEAASAGVQQVYDGPWEFFVGGGVAAFDCNGDMKPELFIAGGKNPAKLFSNDSLVGGPLAFHEIPTGLDERLTTKILGAYPLDIDGDGHMDLAVMRLGENLLLKGGPGCHFEVANRAFGFDGGRAWTTAFAAEWEKDQAFPTLAFGNYVDRSQPGSPWGTCHDNDLFRPQPGDRPRYSERTVLTPGYCTLSMLFTDWNRSGEPSLRMTNDRQYYRGGEEQLWAVPPGKPPRLYGKRDGWEHLTIWGMGIAQFDLNVDGAPEYALTSMGDTKLQTLDDEAEEDRPVYRDEAFDKGATAHRPYIGSNIYPSTGWHSEFADFNNDSLIDLFIAKGNVEAMPDFAAFDPDNLLLGRWDGTFAEAGDKAGIARDTKGRGGAAVDLNLDGQLDLVVINRGQPASLFRNLGVMTDGKPRPMGNWLEIRLKAKGGNVDGVGSKITVKTGTQTMPRDVLVGGGHASGHLGWTHVGVGTSERAQIRVQWPNGDWSHPYRVFANQFVVIEQGAADAKYWYPAD